LPSSSGISGARLDTPPRPAAPGLGDAGRVSEQTGEVRRGLLVIGHGSRRPEANATLRSVAMELAATCRFAAVEHAFLELCDPTIPDAYARLVEAGCRHVVAHPFFLFPGVHTTSDIPAQLTAAAEQSPGATWTVTEPLGLHPGVLEAAAARIAAAPGPGGSGEQADDGRDQTVDPGPSGDRVDA
jgi:sirohydrochlorin cobaltochelatase